MYQQAQIIAEIIWILEQWLDMIYHIIFYLDKLNENQQILNARMYIL